MLKSEVELMLGPDAANLVRDYAKSIGLKRAPRSIQFAPRSTAPVADKAIEAACDSCEQVHLLFLDLRSGEELLKPAFVEDGLVKPALDLQVQVVLEATRYSAVVVLAVKDGKRTWDVKVLARHGHRWLNKQAKAVA